MALALLTACASTGSPASADAVLEGPTWRIVEVDGAEVRRGDELNLAPHLRVLSAEGEVNGATGCNRFSGPYRADGHTLRIGQLGTTGMACPEEALSWQDTRILDILRAADGYTIVDGTLWIMVTGRARMRLELWR